MIRTEVQRHKVIKPHGRHSGFDTESSDFKTTSLDTGFRRYDRTTTKRGFTNVCLNIQPCGMKSVIARSGATRQSQHLGARLLRSARNDNVAAIMHDYLSANQ